jgi:hypothetical protein
MYIDGVSVYIFHTHIHTHIHSQDTTSLPEPAPSGSFPRHTCPPKGRHRSYENTLSRSADVYSLNLPTELLVMVHDALVGSERP